MVLRGVIVLFALVSAVLPSRAHDAWSDGSPVPPCVKAACCGPDDVHHLDPAQVHRVEGGYRIDGYPYLVPDGRLLPSPDGE